jgi:hypothetical protein
MHDSAAWDTYWRDVLQVGAFDVGLADLMAGDPRFPTLLAARGVRSILCVGNGASREALSLALLGFHVTALDIAGLIAFVMHRTLDDPRHPVRRIPGFVRGDDGTFAFGDASRIGALPFPVMHARDPQRLPGGGSIKFVTGDLIDHETAPGPFDAVIERRTLQLFSGDDQRIGFSRLAARLGERGTFASHAHHGSWKHGEPCTHFAAEWCEALGFVRHRDLGAAAPVAAPRVALLIVTTG